LGAFSGEENERPTFVEPTDLSKSVRVNPENIMPIDFIGVRPHILPLIIDLPITYIVGKEHYIGR
jgi:hypothetical protein